MRRGVGAVVESGPKNATNEASIAAWRLSPVQLSLLCPRPAVTNRRRPKNHRREPQTHSDEARERPLSQEGEPPEPPMSYLDLASPRQGQIRRPPRRPFVTTAMETMIAYRQGEAPEFPTRKTGDCVVAPRREPRSRPLGAIAY